MLPNSLSEWQHSQHSPWMNYLIRWEENLSNHIHFTSEAQKPVSMNDTCHSIIGLFVTFYRDDVWHWLKNVILIYTPESCNQNFELWWYLILTVLCHSYITQKCVFLRKNTRFVRRRWKIVFIYDRTFLASSTFFLPGKSK